MIILSINFNHDGSAVILKNGIIKSYINTERFSRIKKHPGIRQEDLDLLLHNAQISLNDINIVLLNNWHDKNLDSQEIIELYGDDLKSSWFDFYVQGSKLKKVIINDIKLDCLINPSHHLLHCSLAYFTSPFSSAVSFSWDPTGYGVFHCKENNINKIDIDLGFSISKLATAIYSEASSIIFGSGLFGAGKVMGLAPYGYESTNFHSNEFYLTYTDFNKLVRESDNSLVWYYDKGDKWNAKLAYNVQRFMEEQLVVILDKLYDYCSLNDLEPNICLSGGGALNSVANQVAFKRSKFKNIFLHPACGDDGTAIGAALWYWHDVLGNSKREFSNNELMYSTITYEDEIHDLLFSGEFEDKLQIEKCDDYIKKTASLIADGNVIGWFQGASELGPRALGNRSILGDPRNESMKDILNSKVKFREGFRPFAPSVLNEFAEEWFGLKDSPFMLRVCNVLKSGLPGITHIDKSARIQTVAEIDNPNYYELITEFYKITGVPLIIDTSFNIKGEPIVETPRHAIDCFLNTGIDYLVFPRFILKKK
jgi:carbamoyltransferase